MFFQRQLCAKIKGKRKEKKKKTDLEVVAETCCYMSLCVETCLYVSMCGDMLLHVSTPSVACFYTQHSPRSESVNGEVCVDVCVFVCACVRP